MPKAPPFWYSASRGSGAYNYMKENKLKVELFAKNTGFTT